MAKRGGGGKASLIGGVGALFIGAALLLFIITIILGNLMTQDVYNGDGAMWNNTNDTIDSLLSFATIGVILFGVLGITMIGAAIIAYITGAFA